MMAEFGENIRKAREKLGITQQTLADRLYVTRQAVSRWENGSRYPDLLTAKRLSQELDATLDDLLSNDDMHTYPEVNPLIEYPLHKRVQTALFASSVVTNLIVVIWYIGFILTGSGRDFMSHWDKVAQFSGMLSTALITAVLIIGLVQSIKDRITPPVAARLAVMIFGVDMLNSLAVDYCYYRSQPAETAYIYIILTVAYLLVDAAVILSVLRFFCGKKPHSPIPVYICSGIVIVFDLWEYLSTVTAMRGTPMVTKNMMISILRMLAGLLIPVLFIYMTAVLNRKRKLAKNVPSRRLNNSKN